MFFREWFQGSQIPVLDLAYISAGKEPRAHIREEPELLRHRLLKYAIDDGDLKSCGELGPYPLAPNQAHGGSLLRLDDLAEYAKTVSFGWLNNVLNLWKAVRAEAPQEEIEEMFNSFRTETQKRPVPPNLNKKSRSKGGSVPKYDVGLQDFIDQLFAEFEGSGDNLTLSSLKTWLVENAPQGEGYDPNPTIPDCDVVEFHDDKIWWIDRQARQKSATLRTLERYISRAKNRTTGNPS